ncbi:tRNA (guanine(10)-N2)-methyltransferase [Penicillium taxi]|uniref:tRNA (guanine(10)-N2)-methyltransferase n=1 Tax=Penicillium taxi TaxID=168475 RepID=UPI00254524FC|nr:tRNA (guanine(10)-N2)-methyltransferase [Penicillium taxi]KAJ5899135.1 tRNA (guanine(10)-N2)-methyltransferase [Penicillium taxi]
MEYIVRFAQHHYSFRQPELEAVAELVGVDLEIISYSDYSPYCIVKLKDDAAARALVSRCILAQCVIALWGEGNNYEELHADIKRRNCWPGYQNDPFAFKLACFAGQRSQPEWSEIIASFKYMDFKGPVQLKNPDANKFYVMEEWVQDVETSTIGTARGEVPRKIYMGRFIVESARSAVDKLDLKKRKYISTTSMDAELSLVTANMALAAPGKLFFDPFVGTGSFLVAASYFGALTFGSDIDPRSFRGKDTERKQMALMKNYEQYGIVSQFVDAFTSDLTNTPLRDCYFLDGIVCDPPYGVREGLRVLGTRNGKIIEPTMIDGVEAHYRPGYIPPKRPYGFEAIQKDILDFAARSLVPNGRLAMWMPCTSSEAVDFPVPMHPNLELICVSEQPFSSWSRRLMTYRRLPEGEVSDISSGRIKSDDDSGVNADELNEFRRRYFTRHLDKLKNAEESKSG